VYRLKTEYLSMPKKETDAKFDEHHRRIRILLEELWNPAAVSDGLTVPSLRQMRDWQAFRYPDTDAASRTRKVKRVNGACSRLSRGLEPAFDPRSEAHRIAAPIAEFVAELRRIEPFERGQKGLECLAVHLCCKFAGCPPPMAVIGSAPWNDAMDQGARRTLSKKVRLGPLTEIVIESLKETTKSDLFSDIFHDMPKLSRGRSYRARTLRRQEVSIRMRDMLAKGPG
jgi:hypothetical protein